MVISAEDTLVRHQREAEWLFAANVLNNPERAKNQYGWLSPDLLVNEQVKRFWTAVRNGVAPEKAAIDGQIFSQLIDNSNIQACSPLYLPSIVAAISDDVFMAEVTKLTGKLMQAVLDRRVQDVSAIIQRLSDRKQVGETTIPTSADAGIEFLASLDDEDRTIKTHISNLDNAIGGFGRKNLAILAARPSMGKTSLGYQIAENHVKHGGRAIFFSIEMSRRDLFAKRACGMAQIPFRLYQIRALNDEQKELLKDFTNEIIASHEDRLMIDDRSTITNRDIWQAVSQAHPELVIIDHLGLRADYPQEKEVERLGRISWEDKQIAKEFDCAVLDLYQLNRATEGRENKRPALSDLRGSGRIEENVDVAMFLYRDDYYETGSPKEVSDTELIVAKNRNGARNACVHLEYHLKKQEFFPVQFK